MKKEWFHSYFDESYGSIILDTILPDYTKNQVRFLQEALKPEPNASFLDLFCGKGRHALLLAKQGYTVTALDLVPSFVKELQLKAEQECLPIHPICGDARDLSFKNYFDHVIVLFTSFGYFSDEENIDLLSKIRTSLKPNGTCLIDIENRDYLLRFFCKEKWRKKSYGWLLERNTFYQNTSRQRTLRIVLDKHGNATESERILRL
ncbi:MAG: class I SAM-dependent methyltransferase, partial [Caldisericia bacterium]|nr:class I SAM-dependent methyltransferase [Caldisericia bacterium]